jgi:hypothetical protein
MVIMLTVDILSVIILVVLAPGITIFELIIISFHLTRALSIKRFVPNDFFDLIYPTQLDHQSVSKNEEIFLASKRSFFISKNVNRNLESIHYKI